MTLKITINQLLRQDKVEEALNILIKLIDNEEVQNELIIFSAILFRDKKAHSIGTISWSSLCQTRNKIIKAVLDIIIIIIIIVYFFVLIKKYTNQFACII